MDFYTVRDMRTTPKTLWDSMNADGGVVITNNGKPRADSLEAAVVSSRAVMPPENTAQQCISRFEQGSGGIGPWLYLCQVAVCYSPVGDYPSGPKNFSTNNAVLRYARVLLERYSGGRSRKKWPYVSASDERQQGRQLQRARQVLK